MRDNVHFPQLVSTLLVGRSLSLKALQSAVRSNRMVLVLGQRDVSVDEPSAEDLYEIGTLSEVVQVMPMPDGTMRVVLRGVARARANGVVLRNGHLRAAYEIILEDAAMGPESEALRREAVNAFQQVAALGKHVPVEVMEVLPSIEDTGHLADILTDHLNLRPAVKQDILEEVNAGRRLEKLVHLLISERQVLELQTSLRQRVEQELGNTQREYFLREQLKVIQNELHTTDVPFSKENEELAAAILSSEMPAETREKVLAELRRLERAPSSSPEGMVIRSWLEWLLALPWQTLSEDRLDVSAAASVLDQEHFGLKKVKERILDFLAVRQLSGTLRGPILCFAGPPGVGKTSLGRAIAESLGRQFVRVSLGGVRDEAEIRGHRRTYIGSMPGRIMQGIKQCGTRNPVFMLDEIDKMTMDFRGDPTSALLEALDPEQNAHFSDHYIEAPFDLSTVMFIMTANVVEHIPAPLRDRMEIIHFPSYTESEKLQIAAEFLVPKLLAEHGLVGDQLNIEESALLAIIREYTREAGVRSLSREIATLCRKAARSIAEGKANSVTVSATNLKDFLGAPHYRYGVRAESAEVGAATGLVYTEFGGDIITIETSLMPRQSAEPQVQLTGSLGNVMKESALTAVSFVRAHASEMGSKIAFDFDVHVHVPEGAAPKDGPSAGVTITLALASALTKTPIPADLAMTGEVTLRGRVLPVGGLREKLLAAHRAGLKRVLIPADNVADLEEITEAVKSELNIIPVEHVFEVFRHAGIMP